ncbi:MAG TPA: MFS transporter, partial [Armatimonadota bacterium]
MATNTAHPPPVAEYLRYSPLLRIVIVAGVMLAMVLFALDSTIVNVAIPSMMGNLGATMDQVSWVSTAYMLANVVVLPLTGWLEAYFGRRNLLIFAVILFTASSLLCGVANSLELLVFFRVLQGIGGAPIMATGLSTLMEIYPPRKTGTVMAVAGIGIMVG